MQTAARHRDSIEFTLSQAPSLPNGPVRMATTLNEQFAESRKLEKAIRQNLAGLGFVEEHT
jgi:hypothetical protein